ncbi:MAG TPA: polysaccharide biosynthesis/export family protein [Bacteroidales bacterium]|nr:polysaccharide biosynthesis/export family protein [Bacteroidales bacterium]
MKIKPSVKQNRKIIALKLIFISCLAFSCVTQKQVEYLQNRNQPVISAKEAEFPDYKLKPNDELFIHISSLDEAAANVFTNASQQQLLNAGSIQPYGASLLAHSIDREGNLWLPVVGKITAKDKTIAEVTEILRDSLTHVLSQPIVSIKLVNRYVSVLGEVRNPGHFPYSQDKLTVLDGLGLAGDITEFGNRNEVIMIRNEGGENKRISIDLTNPDLLASGYFYLRPNDIVYVKPLRNKFWNMRQFPFNVVFSTLTTGLLIYNIFRP